MASSVQYFLPKSIGGTARHNCGIEPDALEDEARPEFASGRDAHVSNRSVGNGLGNQPPYAPIVASNVLRIQGFRQVQFI
jgi:hypothetical protein